MGLKAGTSPLKRLWRGAEEPPSLVLPEFDDLDADGVVTLDVDIFQEDDYKCW